MKNHCQSPLNCLRQMNTYTLPPSHPVVIIATVHAAAATLLPSRNQIHIENTVNPTYRSTRETTPQGLESSQVICSPKLPVVADIAQAMLRHSRKRTAKLGQMQSIFSSQIHNEDGY